MHTRSHIQKLGTGAAVLLRTLTMLLALGVHPASAAEPTLKDVLDPGTKTSSEAKTTDASKREEAPPAPPDDLGRGTPRKSAASLLEALWAHDYERAAHYLDLSRLPAGRAEEDGSRLARELKVVLDRMLWIDLGSLSDESQGYQQDCLPPGRDTLGSFRGEDGLVELLLARVLRDRVHVWVVAPETVAKIPGLYERFGYGPLAARVPDWMVRTEFLRVETWQWLGFLVIAACAYLAAFLLFAVASRILGWFRRDGFGTWALLLGPARLGLAVAFTEAALRATRISIPARAVFGAVLGAVVIFAVAWAFVRLLDLALLHRMRTASVRGDTVYAAALPATKKLIRIVVAGLAAVVFLDNTGFDATALLAGLGVGGIALALGAQKTVEDLLGALTIMTTQPVRVGDFCRFGDQLGTIEDIGLRNTAVRTLDRTVVTVPNGQFAAMRLENYSRRDRMWFHPRLGLRYETTPEQLRYLLVEIRRLLYAHPKVLPADARVRFIGFGACSLDLEVFAYIDVRDFGEYLEVAEDLNLRLMDVIAQAGSGFAFPSQTLYVDQDRGLDPERRQRAEAQVAAWRAHNELYLPRFPETTVDSLRASLDYPPTGSPHTGGP